MKTAEQEMTEALEAIYEKRNYVFRNQYLGDNVIKDSITRFLSRYFVYEGVGPDREVRFRKIHNGRLSKPYTVDEIMRHYVENPAVLDKKRTDEKKDQTKRAIKAEILREMEITEDKMTGGQKTALKERIENTIAENNKVFTNKTLPRYNEDQVLADFAKESQGITKPKFVRDLTYRSHVAQVPRQKLEELNSLHSWNPYTGNPDLKSISEYDTAREPWAIDAK